MPTITLQTRKTMKPEINVNFPSLINKHCYQEQLIIAILRHPVCELCCCRAKNAIFDAILRDICHVIVSMTTKCSAS